jgi:hypothetical protein
VFLVWVTLTEHKWVTLGIFRSFGADFMARGW